MEILKKRLHIKTVLLLGLISHLPMLQNGFTYYSDDTYVLNNPLVHGINTTSIYTVFSTYFDGHYHPLTLLSLAITYLISGDHAWAYQLTNLSFHLLSVYLIYKILTKLKFSESVALITALIFAVHPLGIESVCRITERKDTQYVLFLLLALYQYVLFYTQSQKKHYWYSVLFFMLSILSKGQAMVFPFMLYAIEWYFHQKEKRSFHHRQILPLFLISGLFAYLNYRAQIVTGYLNESEPISLTQIITYPSYIVTHYIFKLFAPLFLSAQYPSPALNPYMWLYTLVPLVLIVVLWQWYKKQSYLFLLGAALYILAVFPMLRLVPVSENFMPDRYNYLGLIGLGIWIGGLFEWLSKRSPSFSSYVLVWILGLSALSFNRSMVWKNGLSVWNDAYAKEPNDPYATVNYAGHLIKPENHQLQKGLDLFKKGIQMKPGIMMHHINYMTALKTAGLAEQAKQEMLWIKNSTPVYADDLANKGVIMMSIGEARLAGECLKQAIEKKPESAKYLINLAGYYYNQLEFEKSLQTLTQAEGLHSNYVDMIGFLKAENHLALNQPIDAKEDLQFVKKIYASKEKIQLLEQKINALIQFPFPSAPQAINPEQLMTIGKHYYDLGLYTQAYQAFEAVWQKDASREEVLSNLMACSFSLSRPDLIRHYFILQKEKGFKINDKALNYLKALGNDDL